MPVFSPLVVASLLASAALANPVPRPASTGGCSIDQVVAKPFKPGPIALAQAYHRVGTTVPDDIAAAGYGATATRSASGGEATGADQTYDAEYLVQVSLGGQNVNLDIDTGSADLWAYSSLLSASDRAGHSYYDPSKSSTSQLEEGATWEIEYADESSASGIVYTDVVDIGGVVVNDQAVEAAKNVSSSFLADTESDGLLGLGFSSLNTVSPNQASTFFKNAIAQGLLEKDLFTVDLKKGGPGTFDFGYIDDSKFTGDITYTDVDNSQGFWNFTPSSYAVGGSSLQSSPFPGIADTGTSLLVLQSDVVKAYYKQVTGAYYSSDSGGWVFPSSSDVPSFTVGIGDDTFTVPGSYIAYSPANDNGSLIYGGIQTFNGFELDIYGCVFLKAVFAVFDSEGPQLGFASKAL